MELEKIEVDVESIEKDGKLFISFSTLDQLREELYQQDNFEIKFAMAIRNIELRIRNQEPHKKKFHFGLMIILVFEFICLGFMFAFASKLISDKFYGLDFHWPHIVFLAISSSLFIILNIYRIMRIK